MALTTEQKEVNKDASLLRRAAHKARREEYEAALNKIDLSEKESVANAASDAQNAALEARNQEVKLIQSKIAALQDELTAINTKHSAVLDASSKARRDAYDDLRTAREILINKVDDQFQDISPSNARFNQSEWIPPTGYIEKFAADNAESIAKKKAKRDVKLSKKKGPYERR